jgi:nucleoside 2-deoxyribosyltransferase
MTVRRKAILHCFVIMPFHPEFDGTYTTIRDSFQRALQATDKDGRCQRLDEETPAGNLIERLVTELKSSSLCIADLTGKRPNVMWEVGYAMALGIPTILLDQSSMSDLPFDIHHMQSLSYSAANLTKSLGVPLQKMIIDTISSVALKDRQMNLRETNVNLHAEVRQMKALLEKIGTALTVGPTALSDPKNAVDRRNLNKLEGAWCDTENDVHGYGQIINGDLVVPYCYGGNDQLNGVFYGWKRNGEYWFARFEWLKEPFSGFMFVKNNDIGELKGQWWHSDRKRPIPKVPPTISGTLRTWRRKKSQRFPIWATAFLKKVHAEGLEVQLRK